MEYIVSARKYRPASFSAVVGQQALTTTLRNAVATGKLAHAYLFCGPRGVGKTTCARIFAKVINCEHPKSDGDACGECESCKAFAEQRSLNIFELDAASNNGVNEIKDLMEQTRIPPQVGKYKVFIIDEVHQLSQAAFNAFLKTLEEPPAHVIFILATTEKHKILATILSRCQVYDFERMTVTNTIDHLKKVAEDQGITYEEQALNLIAEKADGGMRDALSIFDQVASFCQGNITYEKVLEDLNVLDADNYFNCIDLAMQTKVSEVMVLLNSVIEKGFDGGHFVTGLAAHVRNVLMAKDPMTTKLIEASDDQRAKYAEQAKRCDTRFLYQALKILNACDVNYRQSSNKRLLVEIALIEVAQILQKDDDSAAGGRLPWKTLKSLFKTMMTQVQSQPVKQVTGTSHTVLSTTGQKNGESIARPDASANGTASNATAGQPSNDADAAHKPKVKLNRIGLSFGNIMNSGKTDVVKEKVEEKVEDNEVFNDTDVQREWLAMCNRMSQNQQYVGIAQRMKNLIPTITTFPTVGITVESEMFRDEINTLRKRLELTLAQYLHNGGITIDIQVAAPTERKKMMLPKEAFEDMVKEYDVLSFLKKELSLELE